MALNPSESFIDVKQTNSEEEQIQNKEVKRKNELNTINQMVFIF